MIEEMNRTVGSIKRLDFSKLLKQAIDEHPDHNTEEKFINFLHDKYVKLIPQLRIV